jgi:hypothetical protein
MHVCEAATAASCCYCGALAADCVYLCSTDGITMGEDVKGKDAAVRWFDSYFSRYSFASHDIIAAAADDGTRSSFSFYMDQVLLPGAFIRLFVKTQSLTQAACLTTDFSAHITCDRSTCCAPLSMLLNCSVHAGREA